MRVVRDGQSARCVTCGEACEDTLTCEDGAGSNKAANESANDAAAKARGGGGGGGARVEAHKTQWRA